MANPKFFQSFYCIFVISVLLSAESMVPGTDADANGCQEVLPWVAGLVCDGKNANAPCWQACQKQHGQEAVAICGYSSTPPMQYCLCIYPC